MIRHLKKVGNGSALILDRKLMDMAGLEENGKVRIGINNGSLVIMPARRLRAGKNRFEACLDRVVRERREVLRRLAQ